LTSRRDKIIERRARQADAYPVEGLRVGSHAWIQYVAKNFWGPEYQDGKSIKKLSQESLIAPATIKRALVRNGYEIRKPRVVHQGQSTSKNFTPKQIKEITRLYKKGRTSVVIAKRFETTPRTILAILRNKGCAIRSSGNYQTGPRPQKPKNIIYDDDSILEYVKYLDD
jgi:DNA-binding NarL/FixJ family response regulator